MNHVRSDRIYALIFRHAALSVCCIALALARRGIRMGTDQRILIEVERPPSQPRASRLGKFLYGLQFTWRWHLVWLQLELAGLRLREELAGRVFRCWLAS